MNKCYLSPASPDVDVDQDVTDHYADYRCSNASTGKEHGVRVVSGTVKRTEEELLIIHMVTPAEEVRNLSKEAHHLRIGKYFS